MPTNGFLKLRRGLDEHLNRISGDALKLYLRLLFRADWRKGKNQGLVTGNLAELVSDFGWSADKVTHKLGELDARYVAVERHGNQFIPSVIRILKYDGGVRKSADSSGGAVRKNAESTAEQSANLPSGLRSYADSSPQKSGFLSGEAQETKELEAPEEVLRSKRSSSRKNALAGEKVYDSTDRLFEVKGTGWRRIGIRKLLEQFRPFVALVQKFRPTIDETVAHWGGRILDACSNEDIGYPPEFLAIVRRYRESDEPFYTTQEKVAVRNARLLYRAP